MEYSDANSTCSDVSESLISSISGVSGYQDEFHELRHLIHPHKYPQLPQRNCVTPTQRQQQQNEHEEKICELAADLQNALKLNEKYKSDLFNLEKKIELSFHEKIEALVRKNRQLEVQVENANNQIERLIKNFGNNKSIVTCSKCLELEKSNYELNSYVLSLKDEIANYKSINNKVSDENKQLCIEIQELKPLIEIKNSCIKDLKEKISNQHVEIQMLVKNGDCFSSSINCLKNELNYVKKSEEWYKDQLHICQNEKRILSEDILKCKAIATSRNKEYEDIKIELSSWKNKYSELELRYIKEKENSIKSVGTKIISITNIPTQKNIIDNGTNKTLAQYYENVIEDLYSEITRIKQNIEEKNESYIKISKENSELVSQCLMLQKSLQMCQLNLEDNENSKKDLQLKLVLLTSSENLKSSKIKLVQEELQNAKIELTARKQEKEMVENTIGGIRNQFSVLKNNYESLKKKLNEKNREVLQLQNEKQELFMNNNWNLCELEKVREQLLIIKKLQEVIARNEEEMTSMQKTIVEYETKTKTMSSESTLKEQEFTKENEIIRSNLTKEIDVYNGIILQYKNLVDKSDDKVRDLQKQLAEGNSQIEQLQDNLKILKTHVQERDVELSEARENYELLNNDCENKIQIVEGKMAELIEENKKLRTYSTNIYNNLNCKLQEGAAKTGNSDDRPRNVIQRKLAEVQKKIDLLRAKTDETSRTLQMYAGLRDEAENLSVNDSDEIKNLKALLMVKDMEKKERQKKYESNYRTLLRKVKEHMKGRNMAEKQNSYLQSLYNSLSEECNSLKLSLGSKDFDVDNMRILMEEYNSVNKKLKLTIMSLEQELENNRFCKVCCDYEITVRKLTDLETYASSLKKENNAMQNDLLIRKETCNNLKQQIQDLMQVKENLLQQTRMESDKLNNVLKEREIFSDKLIVLEMKLEAEKIEKSKLLNEIEVLKQQIMNVSKEKRLHLQDINEKYQFVIKEKELLSCKLHEANEEIKQLQENRSQLETDCGKKEKKTSETIETLKGHIQALLSELDSHKTEKFFLERLCNDLKIALKSNVNQNKNLKQNLSSLLKEKEDFSSLPMVLPDLPKIGKYDDKYINDLLQQNKAPLEDKPLIEIKGCLDSLKSEIATLQRQITKKNFVA